MLGTERFEDVYLPEIYELLNDEESHVRVEAIEAILEVLEHIDSNKIEQEFIPSFFIPPSISEFFLANQSFDTFNF